MRVTVIDTPQLPNGEETVLLDTHGVPAGLAVLSMLAHGTDIPGLGHIWFGRFREPEDPFTMVGEGLRVALCSCSAAEPGDYFDFPLATVLDAAAWLLDDAPRFQLRWRGHLPHLSPYPAEITCSDAVDRRRAVWAALCLPGLSATAVSAAMRHLQGNGPRDPAWLALVDSFPPPVATVEIEDEDDDDDDDPCRWDGDEVPEWSAS